MKIQTLTIGELTVNRLGFGAMRVLGDDIWGEPEDRSGAKRLLRHAVSLGIDFIDTAESYGPQTDETLIAEALHPYPKGLVIATKCGISRPSRGRWDPDGRPEKLKSDLEGSLKRLKLERIDLYQLHTVDPKVPLADSIGTLADFQKAGRIRHIGVSNFNVRQLEQAQKLVSVVSVQNRYNLGERSSEDVLKACEKQGLAFLPWYPLGDGAVLRSSKVINLAKRLKATPAQVAIAWLLAKSPVMLPIPGTSSISHLEENMAAVSLKLSEEDLNSL
jgi:pyridoxine 4-dehydrogenase